MSRILFLVSVLSLIASAISYEMDSQDAINDRASQAEHIENKWTESLWQLGANAAIAGCICLSIEKCPETLDVTKVTPKHTKV